MKKLLAFIFIPALCLLLASCTETAEPAEYTRITAQEALDMMVAHESFILLDVRTEPEFLAARIYGAVLMPDFEIAERAQLELPDKNALILVYCHAGIRSESAARALIYMGYTRVYDFGGIVDWQNMGFDTVSG